MAKSKRNLSRKLKQSRKRRQNGTKRNRKLKRGKIIGGYDENVFMEKFKELKLPNLGADVDSEISRISTDSNAIKDFLTNGTKSVIVSGATHSNLTGYEKYCIETTTRYPRNFTINSDSIFSNPLNMSIEKKDLHEGKQDKDAVNAYLEQRKLDVKNFIGEFSKKKQSILDFFNNLDNPSLFRQLQGEKTYRETSDDREKLDEEAIRKAQENYVNETDDKKKDFLNEVYF